MTYAFIGGMGTHEPATGITMVKLAGPETTVVGTTAENATNPMYLAASPKGRTLYAAHAFGGAHVSAWSIDDDHRLTWLGSARPSGGGTPCHLCVHPSGRYLLTANYTDGTTLYTPSTTTDPSPKPATS